MKRYLSDNKQPVTLDTKALIYTERPPPKYTRLDWILIGVSLVSLVAIGVAAAWAFTVEM